MPAARISLLLGVLLAFPSARAGAEDADGTAGMSKQMRMAVQLYESGQDLDAMDRFMEILVKGDPAERPRANEYMNLITQRMALGSKMAAKEPPRAVVIEKAAPPQSPRRSVEERRLERAQEELPPYRPERPVERGEERMSKSDREVMKREIEGKVLNRQRSILEQLRKYEDLQIRMASTRLPRAIGIPPSLIYESGVEFKKDSARLLNLLGSLVFSLGATQVVLLPERALVGDSKILDMRRTMGISSHLMKAGVAPARVRVNLLANQVDIPQDLQGFQGILVVFVYNQPLTLNTESSIGAESGPPMSLGVSPDAIDPEKGEGSIIEFSVIEPPSGLMTWQFQLMGPGARKGDDLVVLQEVKGSAPVFHQIYWNGRRQYFGPPLSPGRYECVLSATDMRNRTHKEHEWITVLGPAAEEPKPEAAAASAAPAQQAQARPPEPPPAELPGAEVASAKKSAKLSRGPKGKTMGRKAKGKAKAGRKGKKAAKPAAEEPAAEGSEPKEGEGGAAGEEKGPEAKGTPAEKGEKAAEGGAAANPAAEIGPGPEDDKSSGTRGAVNYQVTFVKNTANITPDGESIMNRVADTMRYYPLDNINIVGYAYSGDKDAEKLAKQRADLVEKVLVERYSLKRDRIKSQSKVIGREVSKAEIYIVPGGGQ